MKDELGAVMEKTTGVRMRKHHGKHGHKHKTKMVPVMIQPSGHHHGMRMLLPMNQLHGTHHKKKGVDPVIRKMICEAVAQQLDSSFTFPEVPDGERRPSWFKIIKELIAENIGGNIDKDYVKNEIRNVVRNLKASVYGTIGDKPESYSPGPRGQEILNKVFSRSTEGEYTLHQKRALQRAYQSVKRMLRRIGRTIIFPGKQTRNKGKDMPNTDPSGTEKAEFMYHNGMMNTGYYATTPSYGVSNNHDYYRRMY